MTDITERLRRLYVQHGTDYVQEAADEIESLRAELARKDEFYTRLAEVHEGAMKMWESDERECAMKAYELAAENKGVREEIERLRAENSAAWDSAEYNAQRARTAEATIERLREYARHEDECAFMSGWTNEVHPCDCGYDELMKELEEAR